jgi:cation transport ATPase
LEVVGEDKVAGALALEDTVRPESGQAIAAPAGPAGAADR